jgi:glucan 1,3-beta-glucosidase
MSTKLLMNSALLALVGLSLFHSVSSQFSPGFPYDSQKVRGVNLGGWLLLEVHAMTVDDGLN